MGQPPQRTAKQNPIKPAESSLNLRLELGDKLFHGVSSWCMVDFEHQPRYLSGNAISVCGLPLCGAGNLARQSCPQPPFRRLFQTKWTELWVILTLLLSFPSIFKLNECSPALTFTLSSVDTAASYPTEPLGSYHVSPTTT